MTVAQSPATALLHPKRKLLHDAVLATPGINFRTISRQVGLPSGTARHHLSLLIRAGLLREERVGCSLAFLQASDRRSAAQVAVLLEPGMVELRDAVAAGRVCQREVLDRFDAWPRSTTQHRLQRLAEAGVLRVIVQGRYLFYEVAA